MHEMSQYGSCDRATTLHPIDFDQNDSRNESICTTVVKVDKVSKHYLISEDEYNSLNSRSKMYCALGGSAAVVAFACLIYHTISERPDSKTTHSIMSLVANVMLFLGIGIGMSMSLVYTREYNPVKHS